MITGRPLREMVLSILVVAILCTIFFVIDSLDGATGTYYAPSDWRHERPMTTPLAWAPGVSGFVASLAGIYIFYGLAPYAVYHSAKRQGRNAVRWTTAFIVFTPILGGIAYLLTWPSKHH